MAKNSKGDSSNDPKASTDSSTTIEDDDSKGQLVFFYITSLLFALNVNVDVVFKVLRQFLQLKSWKIATLILNVTQIIMHIADHKFFPAF